MKKRTIKSKKVVSKKALRSPIKAVKNVLSKIKQAGKKIRARVKSRVSPPKKSKLILKKSFSRFVRLTPPPSAASEPSENLQLPAYYSEDKLVLLIRDPWWLYGYWEVTPGREAEVMHQMASQNLEREKTLLRVYDMTDCQGPISDIFFDIEIHHLNSHWYVDVGVPNREWMAEIGYKARDGRFFALVRSNHVKTPPFGLSDVLDEEWLMPDEMYFKLLSVIGGFESSGGSHEIRRLLERSIRLSASSESAPKFSKTSSTA